MRILIADDHDLLRDTLRLYLETESDMDVQTAADFDDAMELVRGTDPFEVVLLDYNMPGMRGLDGLRDMQRASGGKVALISGVATRREAQAALDAGAAGFLPKTLSAKSLVNAVRFMAMGEVYAPIEFMTAPEEPAGAHPLVDKLSRREYQVLEGLSEGKSNKEIARDLEVQETTVKLHVKTLYRKLGVSNRTQAALSAREAGLF
ncbi:response regulator transcription factor [Rhodovulum sp. DZ06]|uniref:response regulator transcription factor n=1 Tax=Rhodovulum sp. DZ06 TaxID=3425126 RepID=UPI003D356917